MSTNNILETSATTGAGDLTLVGPVTNFKSFSSQLEINQRENYVIDNENGLWETGIGYLTTSTNFVREYVFANSIGDKTKISFTGTLQVFVAASAEQYAHYPAATAAVGNDIGLLISPHYVAYQTSFTRRSNQLWLSPWLNFHGDFTFTGWGQAVNTVSAGAVFRQAIYLVDEVTGLPTGSPYMESDDMDATNSGFVSSPFTSNVRGINVPIKLPSRFYIGMAFEDATIETQSTPYTSSLSTWRGRNSNGAEQAMYQGYTMGTPTPGSPSLPDIGTLAVRGETYPMGGLYI